MLAVACAVTRLDALRPDTAFTAGADGRSDGCADANIRSSEPIIAGAIAQCVTHGYRLVYHCSKMDRSLWWAIPVASPVRLC